MSEEELPLLGKVAVVTGASSGIGKGAALAWAALGADTVICARTVTPRPGVIGSLAQTKEAIESMGRRCLAVRVDIAEEADIERLGEETLRTFDHVDIVFNNVAALDATGFNATFWDMTPTQWREQIDVNLTGVWLVMKAFVPSMRSRGGIVINMTSGPIPGGPSVIGLPGQGYPGATYMVTKVGVDRMTASLALEFAPFGISVVALCPGKTMVERSEPRLVEAGYDLTQFRPVDEAVIPSLRWMVTHPNPLEFSGTVQYAPLLAKELART